ncbi:MAG: sulfatase-like hydrolase/transferase [Bryobacterales bacterium]|nr:sulfatase-like hydrolase/transferase [Bryobacterales bacterium]
MNTPATRRGFVAGLAGSAAVAGLTAASSAAAQATAGPKPNILWITCEDMGPHLHGCGDDYSVTPNLDGLMKRGLYYKNAWSNAPVCAPARTTIISGIYPTSNGSEHMRSQTRLAPGQKMYPQLLREAGYYCTNNSKTDYNLEEPGQVWDESSPRAHWRKRAPGQPFFAIFNFTITHESQIRKRPHEWKHDPAKARVPAYHPDTPEVRQDWAQYYDNITTMDGMAGKVMEELRADGLEQDTIVFFYGDHGSGMPRSKRWPFNSGLNVSIVVHIPDKYKHLAPPEYKPGGTTDRLVGFVDLAPTLMSLTGRKPEPYHQGQAFLGPHAAQPRQFNYGFRGRMDERFDMVRTVRDQRYVYVRNYMPHKIYGQYIAYMFETPTTAVWKKMYDEGKLNPAQRKFWETKPAEELYDLETDRDEVNNLAASPIHRAVLEKLRKAQQEWVASVRDVGFLPEGEIHARAGSGTPYEMGHDEARYPMKKIVAAADLASSLKPGVEGQLVKLMADADSAVRYWGAMGLLMRGDAAVKAHADTLRKGLDDAAPYVKIASGEALGRYGSDADAQRALDVLLTLAPADKTNAFISLAALNAIAAMGPRAKPAAAALRSITVVDKRAPQRPANYGGNVVKKLLADLGA